MFDKKIEIHKTFDLKKIISDIFDYKSINKKSYYQEVPLLPKSINRKFKKKNLVF